ncbi:MAG: hypothetical protein ACK44B_09970 [Flavobacteriales bacterium]
MNGANAQRTLSRRWIDNGIGQESSEGFSRPPLTFSLTIKAIKVNSINPSAGFTANALMLFEKRKD